MAINKITTDFLNTVKARSKGAMDWFRDIVKQTQKAVIPGAYGRKELMGKRNIGAVLTPEIGKMYLFQYEAKYREILPYWDKFPLVFPFDEAKTATGKVNGFYGINLHYLPVKQRIELLTALIQAQGHTDAKLDDNYELAGLNYTIIKGFSSSARKCIKRYINERAYRKSHFYNISGQDWSYAAALPLQKFVPHQPW